MFPETTVASFLAVCLASFFSVNLHNVLRTHRQNDNIKPHAEIERPSGFAVGLAALGTFAHFAETLLYLFLVFFSLFSFPDSFLLPIQLPLISYMQFAGIILMAIGYFLFIWSVIARGKYSVSWEMRDDHRLVTCGPYHYVRHPSYLAYFLMFIGLFALLPSLFTLIPLAAIPATTASLCKKKNY